MPRGVAGLLRWLAALALVLGWQAAAAQGVAARGAAVLSDAQSTLPGDDLAQAWLDTGGTATLEDLLQAAGRFAPVAAGAVHPLAPGAALWMRLRLVRGESDRHQWLLVFPNPLMDQVDVWQRDERGRWRVQSAGDTVAVDRWPEPGRYPAFRLDLPGGQARDVYVRVRSAIATSVPLRLATDAAHGQQQQRESLGLGLAFGALLLLLATCLVQGWAYRDRIYAWYAAFAMLSTLCVLAYTGVAAYLLWPFAAAWADLGTGCLAAMAAGASTLFVRKLTALSGRHARLDRAAESIGWFGLVLALAYLVLDRKTGLDALSAYMLSATVLNVVVAGYVWRRGDVVGMWVLIAYVPMALSVAAALSRLLGWLPISFTTQYAVVAAIVFEVPLMLVALSIRSRDRHGAEIRALALASQDALTGLLASHLFHDRLHQVVSRFKRDGEDAAIVFIDLVNYGRIKSYFGQTVAEQSLLRSVIKLRRLVRDVDTVSRIGESRFALIMEGVRSRPVVTDRAARLIAAGLMPLQGLKPDVTLQFHIAAVLLCERQLEATDLPDALGALLASMSPRTRRPIRFLKPEETLPAPLGGDSGGGLATDSELPEADAAAR